MGRLGGARRRSPRGVRPAATRRAVRARRHDLGDPGRLRHRLRPRPPRSSEDRDQRVRVPHRRPDRARAGAAGRGGRPRPAGGRRLDPGRALRRGDRRADGARLLHDRLVPHRPPPRRRRDRPARPRPGRPLPRRLVPGRSARSTSTRTRSGSISPRAGRSSTCSDRRGSASSTSALGCCPACSRPRRAGSPTRTSSGWTSRTTRRPRDARRFDAGTPPVPNIYAGLAGMSLIEEAGTAAIEDARRRARRPPDRRPRGARRGRRDAA